MAFVWFTFFGKWIMGKAHSLGLLERICTYEARGHSARAAGGVFGVSAATAVRFASEHRMLRSHMAGRQGNLAS